MADRPTGPAVKRLRAVIEGHVQGVNFRYQTQGRAEDLGLVGYVYNRWDGTVEVVAEGQEEDLQRFLKWLHRGPSMARVSRVQVQWQAPSGEFRDFQVTH